MTLAVFAKTQKGKDEVETKAGGLSLLVRRVLIFIDGKRTYSDLQGLPRVGDLADVLAMLEKEGYIEQVGGGGKPQPAAIPDKATATAATPVTPPAAAPPSPLPQFRLLLNPADPVKVKAARVFMTNTLTTFVGAAATHDLISRLDSCQSHTELRALFNDWYHMLYSSQPGRQEASILRKKLLEII